MDVGLGGLVTGRPDASVDIGLAVAGRSVPGRGGPERQRRPRPDGTGQPLVRPGSA
jgi:hypothetical protein